MTTATAVKETPLLMQGPLVCAVIEDRKTKTRRLRGLELINESPDNWAFDGFADGDDSLAMFHTLDRQHTHQVRCPYGGPGDRLWIRERFQIGAIIAGACEGNSYVNFPDGGQKYRDGAYYAPQGDTRYAPEKQKWKPSIHMPRWASRLTLEITDVRVERLRDISPEDAFAEGINDPDGKLGWAPSAAPAAFGELWDEINGEGSWKSNPWVWVVTFRRLSR